MISDVLTLTIYKVEGELDRFRAHSVVDGKVVDVTNQYEVTAAVTEDGRTGFAVFKRETDLSRFEGESTKDLDPNETPADAYNSLRSVTEVIGGE